MRWFGHRDTVRRSKGREQGAKDERHRNLGSVSKRCKKTRKQTTILCAADRSRIRGKANAIIDREKTFRADARADYTYNVRGYKLAKGRPRYSAAESDSLAEHNVDRKYLELWREMASNFPRNLAPDHRAELFGEWVEEHPDEIRAWQVEKFEVSPEDYAAAYEQAAGGELDTSDERRAKYWDAHAKATRFSKRAQNAWHKWEKGTYKGDRQDAHDRAENYDTRAAEEWAKVEQLDDKAQAVPF
jgi:hypothetical protein